jgi:succinyl-CoA synthetase beta subunit
MKPKQTIYNEYKAEKFLSKYLPVARNQLVKKGEDITIRLPLVLKIISDQALHKSDIGGVRIVKREEDLQEEFNDLLKIAKRKLLKLDGILVQEFHEGDQLIIGVKKDPTFGHVILFGVGGVFTEIFEDTSIRKCPINRRDAQEMIDELKARKLFYGFRGRKLNLDLLKKALIKVSQIPLKHKKIEELDINPFMLNEKTGKVVDARIVFAK